jgi:hypothetical protein
MNLDEALAVHLYLMDRPQTDMTAKDRAASIEAWNVICAYARGLIDGHR